ncbi:hypothetical protein DUX42_05845 [Salmonella enterica]|nr:hypothetical protein [Salmonella enterica]
MSVCDASGILGHIAPCSQCLFNVCSACYTSAYERLSRQRQKVAVNSTISCLLVTKQDKGKDSLRLN